MAKFSEYATDPALVREGRMVPWRGPIRLKIARWMNEQHERTFQRLCKPHLQEIRDKTAPEVLLDELNRRAAAEGLLLGWEGVDQEDGSAPLTYSVDEATKLLLDPQNDDLYKFVIVASQHEASYRATLREAAGKNSPPS